MKRSPLAPRSPRTEAASPEARDDEAPRGDAALDPLTHDHVRAFRAGHGANCSSVGSVVDTLFLGAVVGATLVAAVAAVLREETTRVVGQDLPPPPVRGAEADEAEAETSDA